MSADIGTMRTSQQQVGEADEGKASSNEGIQSSMQEDRDDADTKSETNETETKLRVKKQADQVNWSGHVGAVKCQGYTCKNQLPDGKLRAGHIV